MAEALLIIDYQNDFASPHGALSVDGGEGVAGRINELARSGGFELVVATRDWHPADHSSFVEQGGIWPDHCVQGSEGAELHPSLDQAEVDVIFDKGDERDAEGYSAFESGTLADLLHERGIDNVTVVGLATDYCVKHSALGALERGFGVRVDSRGIAAVDVQPGDGDRALDELRAAGAQIT
jgi:nicotinamidase/pyrazinamidase